MPKLDFKVLSVTNARGTQDVNRIELLQFGKHKLRLKIRSDSYKHQSWAYVEILEQEPSVKWNKLVERPYGAMETPAGLYYLHRPVEYDYNKEMGRDRLWLLDQVRLLLD